MRPSYAGRPQVEEEYNLFQDVARLCTFPVLFALELGVKTYCCIVDPVARFLARFK